jgi:membrane-associated protein
MIGLSALAVSAPLSYLAAFWVPALDAVLPILPSETIVIALGVATAGSTDPRIAVLVLLAAIGAFAGDNLAYVIGRRFGPVAQRRFFAGERGARRRAWAEHTLDRYGAGLIVVCRFIPGGRTAVTVTSGIVGYNRSRVRGQAVGWTPARARRGARAQRGRRVRAKDPRPAGSIAPGG